MVDCLSLKTCAGEFPDSEWDRIVENAAVSSALDKTEKEKIAGSPVAKLLAALPYFAGCRNPDQLAVLKVGMYMAGLRNPVQFWHRENQTVRERIELGVWCPGGDPAVVELVTTFLELISLNDHLNDFESDMRTGHPNPLGANILYYYTRREDLIHAIETFPNQDLVEVLMEVADPIQLGYWGE